MHVIIEIFSVCFLHAACYHIKHCYGILLLVHKGASGVTVSARIRPGARPGLRCMLAQASFFSVGILGRNSFPVSTNLTDTAANE